MPCLKCSNGKYKYGEHGKCVYDTLEKCHDAAAAIHIHDKSFDDNLDDEEAEDMSFEDLFRSR